MTLKGRWPRFQAKSHQFIVGRLLKVEQQQTHPFHLDWHQYAHILRNLSRVGRKTAHSENSHRKTSAFPEVFTGNRCFPEIQATCPFKARYQMLISIGLVFYVLHDSWAVPYGSEVVFNVMLNEIRTTTSTSQHELKTFERQRDANTINNKVSAQKRNRRTRQYFHRLLMIPRHLKRHLGGFFSCGRDWTRTTLPTREHHIYELNGMQH